VSYNPIEHGQITQGQIVVGVSVIPLDEVIVKLKLLIDLPLKLNEVKRN